MDAAALRSNAGIAQGRRRRRRGFGSKNGEIFARTGTFSPNICTDRPGSGMQIAESRKRGDFWVLCRVFMGLRTEWLSLVVAFVAVLLAKRIKNKPKYLQNGRAKSRKLAFLGFGQLLGRQGVVKN